MSNSRRAVSLVAAVAVILLLSLAVACRGFFVNQPNSLAVTTASGASTFSVPPAAQMKATAGAASNVTITATLSGVSGTITGTSTGGTGSQTLTIGPANTTTFTHGTSQQFTAALNNVDVTSSATWTSGDTSVVTFSTTTSGLATFGSAGGTATISASVLSGSTCASGSEDITVQ